MKNKSFKNNMKTKLVIFSIAAIMCLSVIPILPTTTAADYYVNPGDDIQAIITAAGNYDTIHFAVGTYNPPATITINKPLTLLGPQAGVDPRPFVGSARTPGDSLSEAIIDGNGVNRIFYVDANDVIIDGLEVFDGTVDLIRQSNAYSGTIIRNLIVHDATVHESTDDEGIQLSSCSNGFIENNYIFDVAQDGANFAVSTNCVLQNNEVTSSNSENAALYVYESEDVIIRGNYVHDTTASNGIELYENTGDIDIINNLVTDNDWWIKAQHHDYSGNAILGYKPTATGFTVTIAHNTLSNNEVSASSPYHAAQVGFGNGIGLNTVYPPYYAENYDATINIYNNIISSNGLPSYGWAVIAKAYYTCPGPSTCNIDYNDVYNNGAGTYSGTFTVGSNNIYVDPLFVNAGSFDYHLQSSSPCVDTATPYGITTDIEGTTRDATPDRGAYEYYITCPAVCINHPDEIEYCYIQDAIDASTTVNGETIEIYAGTHVEQLNVYKSLTLYGQGIGSTILTSTTFPVITVSANDVTIRDLTITHTTQLPEAIRVVSGASSGLTVEHIAFTNIGASGGANAYGIFIANSFTGLTVADCTFTSVAHTTYYRTIGIFATNNLNLNDFEIRDSLFNTIWTGIYLRSEIIGMDVIRNTFGPQQLTDTGGCAAGVYIGDGTDYNFDIDDIEVSNNTFSSFIRGVYVWNYANDAIIGSFDILDNTFTNALWSSPIRFIAGNAGDENVAYTGPITINRNTFTQTAELTPGANVAIIEFRSYCEHPSSDITITNNEITFSGSYTHAKYGIKFTAWADALTNILIENNIIDGGNVLDGKTGTIPSSGIVVDHYSSTEWGSEVFAMDVLQNVIKGFDHGISIYDLDNAQYGGLTTGSDVNIHCNLIYDNALYGVRNDVAEIVDATCNWWGALSGPGPVGPGTGDHVSSNVNYDPWVGKDIAEAGGPYTSLSTGCVTFAGSANLACCASVITVTSYDWDFGDGGTGTGAAPEHCYATPGTYTATLTATFSMLGIPIGTDTDTATVTVFTCPPDDKTPVIDLLAPEPNTQVSGVTMIEWRAYIPGNEGSDDFYVDLYYGLDTHNWRLIEEDLPNNDPNDPLHGYYLWDTTALTDGDYYILAEVWTNDHSKMNYDIVKPTFYIYNGNLEAMVSDVLIIDVSTNSKKWVKDTDAITVSAGITGASGINKNDIIADLTGLGGGTAVPADEFDGLNAIWHLDNVVCSPSNGPITITVTLLGEDTASNTCVIVADNIKPGASLVKPVNGFYLFGAKLLPLNKLVIIGSVTVQLNAQDATSGVQKAELYLNNNLVGKTESTPYVIALNKRSMGPAQLRIDVYDNAGNMESITQIATIYNFFGN